MMTAKDHTALSEREKEALRLLLAGHDAKSIANTLGLSVHTVNDRLRDARRKLSVSSSREAARRFAETEGNEPNSLGGKEIGDAGPPIQMEGSKRSALPNFTDHRLAWLTGGMLIMSLIIAAVALSTMGVRNEATTPVQNTPTTAARPAETAGSSAARKWVGLLDAGQWDASWQAAGTKFKAQLTSAQWTTMVQAVRQPLGQASSRILQSAVETKTLPGAPAGDYQVVQFQTPFANQPNAVETVVLSREQAGWRVTGYFIR